MKFWLQQLIFYRGFENRKNNFRFSPLPSTPSNQFILWTISLQFTYRENLEWSRDDYKNAKLCLWWLYGGQRRAFINSQPPHSGELPPDDSSTQSGSHILWYGHTGLTRGGRRSLSTLILILTRLTPKYMFKILLFVFFPFRNLSISGFNHRAKILR